MEENRYHVLVWVDGPGWQDALGESLTSEELSIAIGDLLKKYDTIKIVLV